MNDQPNNIAAPLASIATSLAAIAEVLARTNGPQAQRPPVPDRMHIAGQYVRRDGNKY